MEDLFGRLLKIWWPLAKLSIVCIVMQIKYAVYPQSRANDWSQRFLTVLLKYPIGIGMDIFDNY